MYIIGFQEQGQEEDKEVFEGVYKSVEIGGVEVETEEKLENEKEIEKGVEYESFQSEK